MAEVTIIIPNYNGKQLLDNCIRTLERQSVKDFHLLIVDNGSTDGSGELTSDVLDMEWIFLTENTGFCGAVNAGIAHTKTPYFLLLNNDTEVEEHFVEEMLIGIKSSGNLFSCGAQMLDLSVGSFLTMLEITTPLSAGQSQGEKADRQHSMTAQSMCFPAAEVQPFTARSWQKNWDLSTSTILPTWRMWISDTVRESMGIRTVICRMQRFIMWAVRPPEPVITRKSISCGA